MKFIELLGRVAEEPAFESALLLAGDVDPADVRRQLSRWVRNGKIHQLRRGVYALAVPWRKLVPHPFAVANRLVRPSYVSLQSALAHHGLIPEHVALTTSVTTGRPGSWTTPLGGFSYRHVNVSRFRGYRLLELGRAQSAFVATPEKALLDLIRLEPGGDAAEYLDGLRLQNLDQVDLGALRGMVEDAGSPKLARAARRIEEQARSEAGEYQRLAP